MALIFRTNSPVLLSPPIKSGGMISDWFNIAVAASERKTTFH